MNIEPYKELIENIPYEEQAFVPNEDRWSQILTSPKRKITLNNDWVKGFSRKELLDMNLSEDKIIYIIMWGFPNGGRGINIKSILGNCENIISTINAYENKNVDKNTVNNIASELDKIKYLGMSSWSKLLYFCNIQLNNHRLLILDGKIKDSINDTKVNNVKFPKITDSIDSYINYNISMVELASKYNLIVDKLELFLYLFSKILRLRNGG